MILTIGFLVLFTSAALPLLTQPSTLPLDLSSWTHVELQKDLQRIWSTADLAKGVSIGNYGQVGLGCCTACMGGEDTSFRSTDLWTRPGIGCWRSSHPSNAVHTFLYARIHQMRPFFRRLEEGLPVTVLVGGGAGRECQHPSRGQPAVYSKGAACSL